MEEKRCKRCIMPAKYPGITFNSEGICNFCSQYNPTDKNDQTDVIGKEKLIELVRSVKKTGEYDCVVPLSGGKDSIYVLYYAVKELGLKPVAVTYSSGFQTSIAMENIHNACTILNVPCVIEKANPKIQGKLFRESLRLSEIVGSFVRTCINCSTLIKAIPMKVARQKKIPFILWGDSVRESVRLVKMKSKQKTTQYKDIRKSGFTVMVAEKLSKMKEINMTPLKLLRILPGLVRYRLLSFRQLVSMGVPLKSVVFPNKEFTLPKNGPQIIHFFDYIDWDPVQGTAMLEKELNWRHPPDRKSRFDCCLYCFANHGSLQAGGITADGVIDCNLIREGLLTREEAMKAELSRERTIVQECRDVTNRYDLVNIKIPEINHEI